MNYSHEYRERREHAKPLRPIVMPIEDDYLGSLQDEYLRRRNLDYTLASDNGWYPIDDAGTPRLVIPASTMTNTWPYYQARAMDNHPIRYKSPTAPRGDALVVVHPELLPKACIVVEGPMDALAAAGEGYVGIALMGNTPGNSVMAHLEHLLKTFSGDHTILLDKDALEQAAALTAKLWSRGIKCRLKTLHGVKDLAELPQHKRSLLLSS